MENGKDVFASDEIVDADVIEAVKENIQPLQKGRRATALSAIFSTPHAQREAILARKRVQFRFQVEQALNDEDEDEDDETSLDPLDVYSRFVAWTMESYPQGQSAESGLIELLEEATRVLKDRGNYKQDPRYMKLWDLYAGYVDKPQIVYAFMFKNEIGTDIGQFYERYAYILERSGLYKKADEIYRLGIARKVESITHLKSRYSEFQKRMLSAQPQAPTISEQTQRPPPQPTLGQRKVLGETSRSKAAPAPVAMIGTERPRQPNTRMQIFVDPTGEVSLNAENTAWPEIGTRIARTKENRPEVHKMGDGPLNSRASRNPSGSMSTVAPRATFVPFRDEDTGFMPPPAIPSSPVSFPERITEVPSTPKASFTPFRDEGSEDTPVRVDAPSTAAAPRIKQTGVTTEAEALRKDPFKNYGLKPDDETLIS